MLNEEQKQDLERARKLTFTEAIESCRKLAVDVSSIRVKNLKNTNDKFLLDNLKTNKRKIIINPRRLFESPESNNNSKKLVVGSTPELFEMSKENLNKSGNDERTERLEKELEYLKEMFRGLSVNTQGTTSQADKIEQLLRENELLKHKLEELGEHDEEIHQSNNYRGRGRGRRGRYDSDSSQRGRYDPTIMREINQAKSSTRSNVPELTLENFYMHLKCLEMEIKTAQSSIFFEELEIAILQQAQILCGNRFPTIGEAKFQSFKDYKTAILKACGEGTTYTSINTALAAMRLKSMRKRDFEEYIKEWETKATTATGIYVERFSKVDEETRQLMREEKSKEYIGKFIDGMSASMRMKDRLRMYAEKGPSMIEFAAEANKVYQEIQRDIQSKELDEALKKVQEEKKGKFAKSPNKTFTTFRRKFEQKNEKTEIKGDKCPSHPEGLHTKQECRALNKEEWLKTGKCLSCGAGDHIKANCPKMSVRVVRMINEQEISESENEAENSAEDDVIESGTDSD